MSARFAYSTRERCRCPEGQYCPDLHRSDGSWNPRHGSVQLTARVPVPGGTWRLHWSGFTSKAAAKAAGEQVAQLLALADDDTTRVQIGAMIRGAGHGNLPAAEDVSRRLGLGLDPASTGMIVADWLDAWLAGKRRAGRRASTLRGYGSHARVYIRPQIGSLPLERLNVSHIEQVLAAVPGSAGTRNRVLATMRAAFGAAVRQRKLQWNPCAGIEHEPENPPEQQRWSPAEAARFIAAVAGDPLGLAYRVMIMSGCRRAELAGFRWAGAILEVPYADPETGEERLGAVLTVARTIVQLGGRLIEEPTAKSRAGDRLVFVDDQPLADGEPGTATLLREHRKAQLAARLRAGEAWADNDLVFAQAGGRPWLPDHISKRFKRLAARAGVPVIKLHEGGRHTGNSLMYDAQVRPDIVMRQVGHASTQISQRYNHPQRQAHLQASHQVAVLIRQAGSGS